MNFSHLFPIEDTVSETYSERLSGLSEALPASIVTAGKMTVGLTVSSVFGLKHYGGKMLWFGICVGMFGMIPNILLGEQAAEKYRVEEARKAKVFGGGIGGMPGGANMGQQVARR